MARVLIVDLDASYRFAARRVLERSGYEVEEVSDPAGAIQLVRAREVDVCLIDDEIRPTYAFKLLEVVNSLDQPCAAVVLSSLPRAMRRAETTRLGALYLSKPSRCAELVRIVAQALGGY